MQLSRVQQSGFTLVELAILLAIIGLLFSAVLRAEAMIDNAKVQHDIKKLEALRIAYFLYKDQYRRLPGEDANHPGRFKTVLSNANESTGLSLGRVKPCYSWQ